MKSCAAASERCRCFRRKPASRGREAMALGPYTTFIVASYLAVLIVVVLLIAWIAVDYRRQKQRLSDLESKGLVRRSGRK